MANEADLLDRLMAHYRAMPPVAALQLAIAESDARSLCLQAPLAANVNDKGCAFGGSLVSLMTLAGWSIVTLSLWRAGQAADVYVADSRVRYLAPLYGDLHAEAEAAPGESFEACVAALRERGRGRIGITARVRLPDGGDACTMTARYVAIAPR